MHARGRRLLILVDGFGYTLPSALPSSGNGPLSTRADLAATPMPAFRGSPTVNSHSMRARGAVPLGYSPSTCRECAGRDRRYHEASADHHPSSISIMSSRLACLVK